MRRSFLLFVAIVAVVALVIALRHFLAPRAIDELSPRDFATAEAMFVSMLQGHPAAVGDLQQLGFAARPGEQPSGGTIIAEPAGSELGHGVYVVRPPSEIGEPLLLSAPHHAADRFTGAIAQAMLDRPSVAAAAWSSAPRRARPGALGGDLAHLPSHAFTAFATAFAKARPDGRVIQLHGFDQSSRTSSAGRRADIVLSSGSEHPSPAVRAIRACLAERLPDYRTALFPDEVKELGAQTNAQGRALRATGADVFVHVELSLRLRRALVDDPALRDRFGTCLAAVA